MYITWPTRIINVLKTDMALVQSTPVEILELDINWFRLALKGFEDDEDGITFPDTHLHITPNTVSGITRARELELINNYTITFEDGQYAVRLSGANTNIADKVNVNQVSVRSNNSANLIVSGSGLSVEEHDALLAANADTIYMRKAINNKRELKKNGATWELIIYDNDGVTELMNKIIKDKDGNDINDLTAGILSQELANSV